MFHVPANQPVSFTIYSQTVARDAALPNDFLATQSTRIQSAFDMGEPISMLVEEMKLRFQLRRPPATRTPRQFATRIVRVR